MGKRDASRQKQNPHVTVQSVDQILWGYWIYTHSHALARKLTDLALCNLVAPDTKHSIFILSFNRFKTTLVFDQPAVGL
jgi:hypothetical protein